MRIHICTAVCRDTVQGAVAFNQARRHLEASKYVSCLKCSCNKRRGDVGETGPLLRTPDGRQPYTKQPQTFLGRHMPHLGRAALLLGLLQQGAHALTSACFGSLSRRKATPSVQTSALYQSIHCAWACYQHAYATSATGQARQEHAAAPMAPLSARQPGVTASHLLERPAEACLHRSTRSCDASRAASSTGTLPARRHQGPLVLCIERRSCCLQARR